MYPNHGIFKQKQWLNLDFLALKLPTLMPQQVLYQSTATIGHVLEGTVTWYVKCVSVIGFIYPATCGLKGAMATAPLLLKHRYCFTNNPFPVPDGVSIIVGLPYASDSRVPQEVSTASAARSSSNILRIEGARGCFQLHSFPITPYIFLACGAQSLHLAIRWNLDCRSPLLHYQHSLFAILPILSHRYELVSACPESN